jgi:hypothetical protein
VSLATTIAIIPLGYPTFVPITSFSPCLLGFFSLPRVTWLIRYHIHSTLSHRRALLFPPVHPAIPQTIITYSINDSSLSPLLGGLFPSPRHSPSNCYLFLNIFTSFEFPLPTYCHCIQFFNLFHLTPHASTTRFPFPSCRATSFLLLYTAHSGVENTALDFPLTTLLSFLMLTCSSLHPSYLLT